MQPLYGDYYDVLSIGEEGIGLHEFVDFAANLGNNLLVVGIVEDALYEICYLYHHVFLGATCGDGWCAQTDTTGLEGAT